MPEYNPAQMFSLCSVVFSFFSVVFFSSSRHFLVSPPPQVNLLVSISLNNKTLYLKKGKLQESSKTLQYRITDHVRACSPIPVLSLTVPAPGWSSALKLPSTAVKQTYKYYKKAVRDVCYPLMILNYFYSIKQIWYRIKYGRHYQF